MTGRSNSKSTSRRKPSVRVIPQTNQTLSSETNYDPINRPIYYNKGRIEIIDFIEDQQFNFHLGLVVKYLAREKYKDGIKDLKKAQWYLQREIERRTGEAQRGPR